MVIILENFDANFSMSISVYLIIKLYNSDKSRIDKKYGTNLTNELDLIQQYTVKYLAVIQTIAI